jgi:hypothetical protein
MTVTDTSSLEVETHWGVVTVKFGYLPNSGPTQVTVSGSSLLQQSVWWDGLQGFLHLEAPLITGHVADIRATDVELNADIDNNGFVQGDDWDKAMHAYAQNPADSIDRGTEFMFANDTLSNGAWDMQDSAAPSGSADDDVEKIVIRPMQYLDAGELWLEHPNIGGIEFYTTAECTEVAPVKSPTQPVVFSPASPIPQEGIVVYARAESIAFPPANPQVSGDLKLMIRPAGQQDAIEAARIKLTVVKKIGATKHHRAVIDYIREKNSKHYYNWIDTADQESVYVGYIGKKTLMDGIDPRHRFRTIYEAMTLDADAIIVGNYAGDDSGVLRGF